MEHLLLSVFSFILMPNHCFGQISSQFYNVKLKVCNEGSIPGDTLRLGFGTYDAETGRISDYYFAVVDNNNEAIFNIEQPFPYGYFSIIKSKQLNRIDYLKLVDNLFWEDGDDVTIRIRQPKTLERRTYIYDTKFEGENADKYSAIYKLKQKQDSVLRAQRAMEAYVSAPYKPYDFALSNDSMLQKEMIQTLNEVRDDLSSVSFELLKSDIFYLNYVAVESKLSNFIEHLNELSNDKASIVLNELKETYLPIPKLASQNSALVKSRNFLMFYRTLFNVISLLDPGADDKLICETIIHQTSDDLQEALLTAFVDMKGYSSNSQNAYDLIDKKLKNQYYQNAFKKIKSKSKFNINQFSLLDIVGNETPLSIFNSKITLIDIWFTGCSGCIYYRNNVIKLLEKELEHEPRFQIVSVSIDKNIDIWRKSVKLDIYASPHGINLYAGSNGGSHPFMKKLGIIGAPTILLIDKNGDVLEFNTPTLHDPIQLKEIIKAKIF